MAMVPAQPTPPSDTPRSTAIDDARPAPPRPDGVASTETLDGTRFEAPHSTPPRSGPDQGSRLTRGATIGRYVVLEQLGAGGMGIVYAAYDPHLDRRVALKILRTAMVGRRGQAARERLIREAKTLARLSHPNVITVHDVGIVDDRVFIAMEFIQGRHLGLWLQPQRPMEEILDVFRRAGEGLAAAHDAGVVHRDFKPENVLVGDDGRVSVVDFGIALTRSASDLETPKEVAAFAATVDGAHGPPGHDNKTVRLTRQGAILGTPAYMAPEQHLAGEADARADQFSFCVVLYEALYRERPFAGENLHQLTYNVVGGRLQEPSKDAPAVPAWLRRVVLRGLQAQPSERYPSMQALLAALQRDPRARRRKWSAGAGIAAIAALGITAVAVRDENPVCQGAAAELETAWSMDARARVMQALQDTGVAYADDVARSTVTLIDDYGRAFVEAHTDACEATAVRREQSQALLDRRMICLDRRLKELDQLVVLLSRADKDMVDRAAQAAGNLSPLEPCANAEQLMSGEAPVVGQHAARVGEIDSLLATARQQQQLARYEPGMAKARQALAIAEDIDHPASQARALVLLGQFESQIKGGRAVATFHRAVWQAERARNDALRAEAWKDLVWVIGHLQGRYQQAERLANHAFYALERAGENPVLEAEVYNHLGVVARAQKHVDDAIAHHEHALQLRQRVLGDQHLKVAESFVNLANALIDAGRLPMARDHLANARQILETTLGSKHPRLAPVIHAQGVIEHHEQRFQQAAERFQRVLTIRTEALGPKHHDVARSLNDLAWTLLELDANEDAKARFFDAVALKRELLGDEHPSVANSLTGLGLAKHALGENPSAIADLERAVEIRSQANASGTDLAESQFALARALLPRDPSRARSLAREAQAAYAASQHHQDELGHVEAWLAKQRAPTPGG